MRIGNEHPRSLLQDDQVLCPSVVISVLVCGNVHSRSEILHRLKALPEDPIADHPKVLHLVNAHRLYGRGLGRIDAHLLVSVLLMGCELWTSDQLLRTLVDRVGL